MLANGQPAGITYQEVEYYKIENKEQLIWAYNKFVDQGLEGAIVKFPNKPYVLGKRSENWLKLKPKETLDVVITGVVPIQDQRGLRVWGVRYATRKEGEYINMGMIRGLSTDVGNRLAELLVLRGLIPETTDHMIDLKEEIERASARFTQQQETYGFEIEPSIVITIDSLGIVRRGEKVKLRNARFLHIREDKPVDEITDWFDIYHNYMTDESFAGYG
jgi:DNA ligase-1